jgi:hypothetical protein
VPTIRLCFNHFLLTVQSLALSKPIGSRRNILFFIGLFRHLEDLKLLYSRGFRKEPPDDLTLIPPFTPGLRGRLTMEHFTWVSMVGDTIRSFGGIRFLHMYLVWVDGEQLLLGACAETLETLRFDLSDPQSEAVSLKGVQGDNQRFLSRLLGPVAEQIAPGTRGCS